MFDNTWNDLQPHNNCERLILPFSPIDKSVNWGQGRGSDVPKLTPLASQKAIQVTCRQSPAHFIKCLLGILSYFTCITSSLPNNFVSKPYYPLLRWTKRLKEVKSNACCHAFEEWLSSGQNQTLTYPKPFALARPPHLQLLLLQVNLIQKREKPVASMSL